MNIVYKINLWFKDRWYDLELMWRYDKFGFFANVFLYPLLVGFNLAVGVFNLAVGVWLLSLLNLVVGFLVVGFWVFVWKTSMRTVGHRRRIIEIDAEIDRMIYDWGAE